MSFKATPEALGQLQEKIFDDAEFRKRFCDDPVVAMKELGIEAPEGAVPTKIDHDVLEERLSNLRTSLKINSFREFQSVNIKQLGSISRMPGGLGGPRGGELAAVVIVSIAVVL